MTHKRHESNESMHENKILWGLRISERIKNACQITALNMKIPVSHLVSFIIYYWFRENNERLRNEQGIKELVKSYNNRNLNLRQSENLTLETPHEADVLNVTTKWSIRGISIETMFRIKAMAFNNGIPIGKFIDVMTAKEWEKEKNRPTNPGLRQKVKKSITKFFSRHY